MSLKASCRGCGAEFTFKSHYAGKIVPCKRCGYDIRVRRPASRSSRRTRHSNKRRKSRKASVPMRFIAFSLVTAGALVLAVFVRQWLKDENRQPVTGNDSRLLPPDTFVVSVPGDPETKKRWRELHERLGPGQPYSGSSIAERAAQVKERLKNDPAFAAKMREQVNDSSFLKGLRETRQRRIDQVRQDFESGRISRKHYDRLMAILQKPI